MITRREFLVRGAGGLAAAGVFGTFSEQAFAAAARLGATKATFQLGWIANVENMGEFIGDERGYYTNEGLDLIYAGYPKGATGPVNTWLGLFTSWSASTVAGSAAVIASWAEVSVAGAYARGTIASSSWGTVGTTQSGRGSGAAQVTFATATAVWGTCNGFIVCSGATGGAGTHGGAGGCSA